MMKCSSWVGVCLFPKWRSLVYWCCFQEWQKGVGDGQTDHGFSTITEEDFKGDILNFLVYIHLQSRDTDREENHRYKWLKWDSFRGYLGWTLKAWGFKRFRKELLFLYNEKSQLRWFWHLIGILPCLLLEVFKKDPLRTHWWIPFSFCVSVRKGIHGFPTWTCCFHNKILDKRMKRNGWNFYNRVFDTNKTSTSFWALIFCLHSSRTLSNIFKLAFVFLYNLSK